MLQRNVTSVDMDGFTAAARSAWSLEITELERLAAAQSDASMEHCRTDAGPFRLRMRVADLGPVRVQSADVSSGYIARGVIRSDRAALFIPTASPAGTTRVNGLVPEADDLLIGRPGAAILSHTRPDQGWAALALDEAAFGPALAAARPRTADIARLPGRLGVAPALRVLALEAGALAAADPARLSGAAVAGALVEAFRIRIEEALGEGADRPLRADRRHVRIVQAAVDFLDAALARPVYSDEVGRAVGATPRFLNDAFSAVLGMSLHRYLRLRRLTLARRRLQAEGEVGLVKTVALDLGFWHLGRFALAYRDLFGESPSETLASRSGRAPVL